MKKKFIAMLLTASLAASWTVPAFAEETETETASSEALDITFDGTQASRETGSPSKLDSSCTCRLTGMFRKSAKMMPMTALFSDLLSG